MLTYTFSTREKIMLAALAFVAVIVLWYQFVFVSVQNEVTRLDSEIADAQNELTTIQARAMQLKDMREKVRDYQDQGYTTTLLPNYDNTQNLMAYLNGVLASAQEYTISFDSPELSEDDGTIHRTGVISYNTSSYEEARSIAEAIAHGPYTCEISAFGIVDEAAQKQSSSSDSSVVTSLQVTFFEKPTSNTNVGTGEDEVQGNDLSQLSNWDS